MACGAQRVNIERTPIFTGFHDDKRGRGDHRESSGKSRARTSSGAFYKDLISRRDIMATGVRPA